MPAWVQSAYGEYAKRLPKELSPELCEIPVAHRAKNYNVQDVKAAEGKAILSAGKTSRLITMDLAGKAWSTPQLSQHVKQWQMQGDDLSFVIGGPDGLSDECLKAASASWCLSNLTLPHPLVRVVFIEQLYRAWTILQNHPYHK